MKKNIIFVSLLIVFSVSRCFSSVNVGGSLGWVYSNQYQNHELANYKGDMIWKNGSTAGIFVEISHIHPRLAIGFGANYVQKGYKDEFFVTGESGPEILKTAQDEILLDYISFPVYLKVTVLKINKLKINFMAGARLDYFQKYKYTPDTFSSEEQKYSGDYFYVYIYEHDIKSAVFGATAGLSLQYPIANNLSLGLQFEYAPDISYAYHFEYDYLDIFGKNKAYQSSLQVIYQFK